MAMCLQPGQLHCHMSVSALIYDSSGAALPVFLEPWPCVQTSAFWQMILLTAVWGLSLHSAEGFFAGTTKSDSPKRKTDSLINERVLQALPLLSSVALLLLIFVFLFGVAGIQLFQDAAHQTCVNNVDGSYPDPEPTENSDEWGCGHRRCPSNYTCTVRLYIAHLNGVVSHACYNLIATFQFVQPMTCVPGVEHYGNCFLQFGSSLSVCTPFDM